MHKTLAGLGAALAIGAALSGAPALAQTSYPERDVRLVVSFAPGGGTDIVGRLLADGLSRLWGVSVTVENIAGADGAIGNAAIAAEPPDGYNLLFTTPGLTITAEEQKDNYDAVNDFTPITATSFSPSVLIVNPALPINNFDELIAYAKEHPGELSYGSTGFGTVPFLAMELLKDRTGVDIVHIPYSGGGPLMTGMLSGEIDVMWLAIGTSLPQIQEGTFRPLAINHTERFEQLPDVPTIGEAGLPGFETATWYGLFGPAGLPQEIVDKLYEDTVTVIRSEEAQTVLNGRGIVTILNTPDEFAALIKREIVAYGEIMARIK